MAIGANLPTPEGITARETVEATVNRLASIRDVYGICRSRFYSTAPIPAADQPRYINGVVRLHGTMAPEALLACLQNMEQSSGRTRIAANFARTLDLDIIAMGDTTRASPDPILPHPRAHLRAFVLWPLRDVAPGWVHPISGIGIDALIAALPPQDIHPL